IFLVSLETGEKRRLTSPGEGFDLDPAFSPDGRSLAYCHYGGNPIARVFLLDLSADRKPSGEPRALTPVTDGPTNHPTWTPDGREIVCSTPNGLRRTLISGGPSRVVLPGVTGEFPAISRQENRMALVRRSSDSNIWRVDIGQQPRSFI